MASLNEQTNIRIHESHFHGDIRPVRKDSTGVCPPPLNETKNIIPSTAIQARRMMAQFVKDFLHLERSREGLNQHGGPNRPDGDFEIRLSEVKDVRPESSFEVVFHFGKIEVRARAMREKGGRIVEKVECKVEDASREWAVVDADARLI